MFVFRIVLWIRPIRIIYSKKMIISTLSSPIFPTNLLSKIYLHHLIEWFALTNLITGIDRKVKHLNRFLKSESFRHFFLLHAINIHTHTHTCTGRCIALTDHSNFKNACNFCCNLCMIYSIIHLHKCAFFVSSSFRLIDTPRTNMKKTTSFVSMLAFFIDSFIVSIPNELVRTNFGV